MACSKQTPVIESKEIVVQEDKRNISAIKARELINGAKTSEDLVTQLLKIQSFHKDDFSYDLFWQSLRYPQFNVTRITPQNISAFSEMGAKSCTPESSQEFIHFVLYLKKTLENKSDFDLPVLKLLTTHLERCRPILNKKFYRPFFEEISSWNSFALSKETMEAHLTLYNYFVTKKDGLINSELMKTFTQKRIKEHSSFIAQVNDVTLALNYSQLLKIIFPLNDSISALPLRPYVQSLKSLRSLMNEMDLNDFMGLAKKLKTKLPLNETNIHEFSLELFQKLNSSFQKIQTIEEKEAFINSLGEVYDFHLGFSKNISDDLNILNKMVYRSLEILSDEDIANISRSSKEVIPTVLSFLKLPSSQLQYFSLLDDDAPAIQAINFMLEIRRTVDHKEKLELKSKFCSLFELKTLKDLPYTLSSGCYRLAGSYQSLKVKSEVAYSFFSSVEIDASEVVFERKNNKLGVIDLSQRKKTTPPQAKQAVTPKEFDAIGFPLLLGLKSTRNKGAIFERDINYYFFYHYVYKDPQKGPDQTVVPEKGIDAGILVVKDSNEILSLISLGGEGQKASEPAVGGKGYNMEFDTASIAEWVDTLQIPSFFLKQSLLDSQDLIDFITVAEKNSEDGLIYILDPGYVDKLTAEQRKSLDSSLDFINDIENFRCSDRLCKLHKVANLAIQEFSHLVSARSFSIIMSKLNSKYEQQNGEFGSKTENGARGKNGKIIFSNSDR